MCGLLTEKRHDTVDPGSDKESKNAISGGKSFTTLLEIGRFQNIRENVVKKKKTNNKHGGKLRICGTAFNNNVQSSSQTRVSRWSFRPPKKDSDNMQKEHDRCCHAPARNLSL